MPNRVGLAWFSGQFTYKHNDKLSVNVGEQFRIKSAFKLYDRSFTWIEGNYKPIKSLNLGFEYRYMFVNDDQGGVHEVEQHQRFAFKLSHRFKINRLTIKNRIQWQNRIERLPDTHIILSDQRKYLRLKSSFGYNIPKWKFDPKASAELFIARPKDVERQQNKYRFSLGTEYKIKKGHQIRASYIFEREIISWNPDIEHIISLKYVYTLKRKPKPKDEED